MSDMAIVIARTVEFDFHLDLSQQALDELLALAESCIPDERFAQVRTNIIDLLTPYATKPTPSTP